MADTPAPQKPKRPKNLRRAAGQMLAAIDRGKTLDEADDRLDGLAPRERALARAMVMMCLRHYGEIEFLLRPYLKKPIPPRPHIAKALLYLGVTQICYMETADHAAVGETVNACGRQEKPYRGLINAVLRNLSRAAEDKDPRPQQPHLNAPDWMYAQWEEDYGPEMAANIAHQHCQQPPLDLTFKSSAQAQNWAEALKSDWPDMRVTQLTPNQVRLWHAPRVDQLPGFDQGDWWVQDFAASLPAIGLTGALQQTHKTTDKDIDKKTGLKVLDLCAAPGGKTLQLAAAGFDVTALDISETRLARLKGNLARTKLSAKLVCADAMSWQATESFDAILLDAPCSASGTIRRHPDLPRHRRPGYVKKLINLQDSLLRQACQWLAPGGLMIYGTCSLDTQEGEARIKAFLAQQPDMTQISLSPFLPERAIEQALVQADGSLRTTPAHMIEAGGIDGFYAALLTKKI